MSTLSFMTFLMLFRMAFWAVSALASLPMIRDLAEACKLRIRYVYALTLSESLKQSNVGKSVRFFDDPTRH